VLARWIHDFCADGSPAWFGSGGALIDRAADWIVLHGGLCVASRLELELAVDSLHRQFAVRMLEIFDAAAAWRRHAVQEAAAPPGSLPSSRFVVLETKFERHRRDLLQAVSGLQRFLVDGARAREYRDTFASADAVDARPDWFRAEILKRSSFSEATSP
jgi:hypothetical protein